MTVPTEPNSPREGWRPPGLLIATIVVVLGILPGAAYFHYKAPRVKAQVIDKLRDVSTLPGDRLDAWLGTYEGQIRDRLAMLCFSSKQPWLVTHTFGPAGVAPEIWGLDLRERSSVEFVREDLHVEIRLPAPVLLGHGVLHGDNARHIPHYTRREDVGDPATRAEELVAWFLPMIKALPRDIPGAELVVRVQR